MHPQGTAGYCVRQYPEDKAIPNLSVKEEAETLLYKRSVKPTDVTYMANPQFQGLLKRVTLLGQLLLFGDFMAWSYFALKILFKVENSALDHSTKVIYILRHNINVTNLLVHMIKPRIEIAVGTHLHARNK